MFIFTCNVNVLNMSRICRMFILNISREDISLFLPPKDILLIYLFILQTNKNQCMHTLYTSDMGSDRF